MIHRSRPGRFRRPTLAEAIADRVPPGQFVTPRWPVLHQGEIPRFDPAVWEFRIWGLVGRPGVLTWDEMRALPARRTHGDLHCVTRWSTLDHVWEGISPEAILEMAGVDPRARFVMLHGAGGYSANLSLAAFLDENVVLATHHDGDPLTPEHGAPLRAVVPERYAWKSVKWLSGLEFLADDQPGFWEGFGYSNAADPWREERFES